MQHLQMNSSSFVEFIFPLCCKHVLMYVCIPVTQGIFFRTKKQHITAQKLIAIHLYLIQYMYAYIISDYFAQHFIFAIFYFIFCCNTMTNQTKFFVVKYFFPFIRYYISQKYFCSKILCCMRFYSLKRCRRPDFAQFTYTPPPCKYIKEIDLLFFD